MTTQDKAKTKVANKRVIDFINSPLILILITSNLLLIQVFFQSTLDLFSRFFFFRLFIDAILFFIILRMGEGRKWLRITIFTIFLLLGLTYISVIVHIRYFKVVPTLFSLKLLFQLNEVAGSVSALIKHDQIALFIGLILCLSLYLFRKQRNVSFKECISSSVMVLLLLLFPWGKLGYDLLVSNKQVKADFHISASNAIDRYGYLPYLCYHYFYIQSQLNYKSHLPNPLLPRKKNITSKPTKYNFLIIQAESLDNALLDRKDINGIPVTPVLNKLKADNIYFPNFYAQHAGGGSSDAEIAALTGLLPLHEIPTMSSHDLRHLPSLVKILKEYGYKSYALHGNVGNFWNRFLAYKQLGFEHFYDKKYYSELAGGFGSLDGEFFKESIPYIEEISKEQPFFIYLITLTMHCPYNLTIITEFNKHIKANIVYNEFYYQRAVYTDRALGVLLDELRKKGILDNTVVLIFGDHTSGLQNDEYDCGKNESENIPLIILHPDHLKGIDQTYGSHIDIAPTILDLAGLSASDAMFGRSLLTWHPERINPIAVGNRNYIVTPMGNLPFEDAYSSVYSDILKYSRSYFYEIPDEQKKKSDVLSENRYIAHAMGSINNKTYTNSREAFVRSYDLGLRLMEVDFSFTKDKKLVCFHDGMENRIGLSADISEISRCKFLELKMDEQYTLLDFEGLLELMKEYPDVYIVTDIKGSFTKGVVYMVKTINRNDPDLMNRIILKIYSSENLVYIRQNNDFKSVIFTMYRSDMSNKQVVEFVLKNSDIIKAVTVGETVFSASMAADFLENKIPLFVHIINDSQKMEKLSAIGAYGFYTDLFDSMTDPVQINIRHNFKLEK